MTKSDLHETNKILLMHKSNEYIYIIKHKKEIFDEA